MVQKPSKGFRPSPSTIPCLSSHPHLSGVCQNSTPPFWLPAPVHPFNQLVMDRREDRDEGMEGWCITVGQSWWVTVQVSSVFVDAVAADLACTTKNCGYVESQQLVGICWAISPCCWL
jgi:hypothetical protein